ncbi:hypothetical protein [Sphingomonas sp.]
MFRSLLFLSAVGGPLAAGGAVAHAQTQPATQAQPAPTPAPTQTPERIIPPIDFSLPPGESQARPAPPPAPTVVVPVPLPAATPTPRATPAPAPTPTPTPRAAPTPAPTAGPAPVATPATIAPEPTPEAIRATPAPEMPVPEARVPEASVEQSRGDWRWWLLAGGVALVIAAMLAILLRRRRERDESLSDLIETAPAAPQNQPSPPPLRKRPAAEKPPTAPAAPTPAKPAPAKEPASADPGYLTVPRNPTSAAPDGTIRAFVPPPPAPAGLVTAFRDVPAPMLQIELNPVRAGTTDKAAVLEFAFTLRNPGPVAIGDALVSAWMLTANAGQDQQIAGYLAEEPDPSRHNLFALRPGEHRELSAAMGLPFDMVSIVEAGERRFCAPMLLIDARYRTPGGKAGRTFAAFMIGRPLESGKLQPLFTDRGPRMVDGVVARPYPIRIARA